ncbi:unnamed protein product, partial [Laminaria digitata]
FFCLPSIFCQTELLGELQLSFVLFVSLSSLRGFRHWQAVSALLCRCGDGLATDPALFTAFIRMLHAHLKLVPEDFFDVELSKDNFLVPCLSALVQNVLPDKSLAPTLMDAGKRLLKFLRQRFGLFAADAHQFATSHPRTRGSAQNRSRPTGRGCGRLWGNGAGAGARGNADAGGRGGGRAGVGEGERGGGGGGAEPDAAGAQRGGFARGGAVRGG